MLYRNSFVVKSLFTEGERLCSGGADPHLKKYDFIESAQTIGRKFSPNGSVPSPGVSVMVRLESSACLWKLVSGGRGEMDVS